MVRPNVVREYAGASPPAEEEPVPSDPPAEGADTRPVS
jgi:hypothetical protein